MSGARRWSSISRRFLRGAGTPPRASRGFPHSWREGAESTQASASFFFFRPNGGDSLPLSALLGLLATLGCEDVRHDYFPLAVGSSWTYRVVSEGEVIGRESIRVVERVERSWDEDDGRAQRFSVREPGAVAVWTKDEAGVLRILGGTVTTILQYPPFIGFGWTDEGPGGRLVYCKVTGCEAVRTPADWFFDCTVVEREAEDLSSVVRQWFAPEVGLVKWRVERPGRPAYEWLLEEHRVGDGAEDPHR